MLFLLTLLTASYFAAVLWVRRAKRACGAGAAHSRADLALVAELPVDDQPPSSAVGWPPRGKGFTTYVDEGLAAIDAYLAEGFAA